MNPDGERSHLLTGNCTNASDCRSINLLRLCSCHTGDNTTLDYICSLEKYKQVRNLDANPSVSEHVLSVCSGSCLETHEVNKLLRLFNTTDLL